MTSELPATLSWYLRQPDGVHRRLGSDELTNANALTGEPYWLAETSFAKRKFNVLVFSFPRRANGRATPARGWRTIEPGMNRLIKAARIEWKGNVLLFRPV